MTSPLSCSVALKEWAATTCALCEGRQIIVLRKGGLLDPATENSDAGTFHFEYSNFWILPTQWHQNPNGIKPETRDWFAQVRQDQPPEDKSALSLGLWARVEQVWNFGAQDEERLMRAPHIWSRAYLDTRFNYKPEHPLICAALRVYQVPQAHRVPMQPTFGGCRSWLELGENLSLQGAQPVLNDAEWARRLAQFEYSIA